MNNTNSTVAVIMAGGKGTRLYPLTASTPKPLLPICGTPIIEKIINDLKKAGISEIRVTLGYLGSVLEKELKKKGAPLDGVSFIYEEFPLGTAGAVKNALIDKVFSACLVVSGDALFEGDYSELVDKFYEKKADALIACTRVTDVERYGVIVENQGDIIDFVEKPKREDTPSNLISTGIYVLSKTTIDMIPDGVYDFGKELFPDMLKNNKKLISYEIKSYWCDIGTIDSYYDCNMRASKNKNVIGKCKINQKAEIVSSIVFDGASIGGGCVLDGCIIGKNASIADNVHIGYGAVIGEGSVVTHDVPSGTTILPQ